MALYYRRNVGIISGQLLSHGCFLRHITVAGTASKVLKHYQTERVYSIAVESTVSMITISPAKNYPGENEVMILCDGGGSNSATAHLFKEDLQKLSDRSGLT